jgi:hypothetical protein
MRIGLLILILMAIPLLLALPATATTTSLGCEMTTQFIYSNAAGETWTSLRSQTSCTQAPDSTNIGLKNRCDGLTDKYDYISRVGLSFDSSALSGGAISSTLSLYITNKGLVGDLVVVGFEPEGGTWGYGDFNEFGAVELGRISMSDITINAYNNITLDPSCVDTTGFTYLGVISEYDFENSPPPWSSGLLYQFATVNYYNANEPKLYVTDGAPTPTATIAVNLYEKYSNAILVNQAITVAPSTGGDGETKTSLYGETLYFDVAPSSIYWFNASRSGYQDYNETYLIPASPGIYNVYMERILTPIANHSYAHFSVVDQTNGGLIPNAEVRLSDGQTKLTNSAGYTWFSVNNSEQINYYVSKPSGYWPAYGAFNITSDESILVALQRYTGPTATATMPGWTPVTVPTTGTGVDPVVTLSAQLRQQNVQEGMDVWYTNLPFISQFLFLLFIIGGLGLMAGGTRRN